METAAIILAAGAGTRMKSKKPKVAHEILGKPLVQWVLDAAKGAGISRMVSVIGHGREQTEGLVEPYGQTVVQEEQLGTAHAVLCAMRSDELRDFQGSVVILSGDCPLITSNTIGMLMEAQEEMGASAAILTMVVEDPSGYGRIVRDDPVMDASGACEMVAEMNRIVEHKDASADELGILECNSGFYCFDATELRDALAEVGTDNAQGEMYLTDVIEILKSKGKRCIAVVGSDPAECLGVNSRRQLAEAAHIMQRRVNDSFMDKGVTMMSPENVWIGPDVTIERDVEILPNVFLFGNTSIGEDSIIGPSTRLTDTVVGRGCRVDETVAIQARIDDGATCGPRCYLRPEAHLCEGAKAGTHVEIKKSTIGKNSKVPHLSYIGDTTMGENVNIGAGSITCNYDGKNKHKTTIGDNTFVGSDTMMVAPVSIGDDAVIGAGSVITQDVPDGALAVERSKERIIDGWSAKHRK